MSLDRKLSVHLQGNPVGTLTQDDSGRLTFHYDEAYLTREDVRPLSLAMPLRREPYEQRAARPFFAALLPDDDVRRRLAQSLQVSEKNDFALLREVGGECAGAVSLYPEGEEPRAAHGGDCDVLSVSRLADLLRSLPKRPLLVGEGVRLSLAGAQDKIALHVIDGDFAIPLGDLPTTHILKPAIEGFADTVQNELFCMRLAKRLGLAVPNVEFRSAGDVPFLLVKRYDRATTAEGLLVRRHQEDFCQALGIPPELKYQREGGPSLAQCFDLLAQHSMQPAVDRLRLLTVVIFNYVVGNEDAHGKNFSMLHEENGSRLAPFYDLLSTVVYAGLERKMAMKIGGYYEFDAVLARHWNRFAEEVGLSTNIVRQRLREMINTIAAAAHKERQELAEGGLSSTIFADLIVAFETRTKAIKARLGRQLNG